MRRISIGLFSVLILAALAGCATIPVPKPVGEGDCLIIIKTEVDNNTSAPFQRSYTLKLSTGGRDVFIPTSRSSFAAFVVKEPATRIMKLVIGEFKWGNYYGKANTYDFDYILPYRPGYAVVADIAFKQTIDELKEGGVMSYFDTREVEEGEKAAILEEFAAREGSELWKY